ncbi:MAG: formate dehydrogenase subunit gamma, partial [Thiohalomonadales bacterium]
SFERFDWRWRANHWTLALSVMTLVFTGMAVMYPDTAWSMAVINAAGGPSVFGLVHRIVGVIFILTVTTHIVAIVFKLIKKDKFDWFGPDSLLPRKKDWQDMKSQFHWFFHGGDQAKFDRWTYWEKFDYWAVYWGAFVIGTSGIVLWYSDTLVNFLPGWMFNLASLAHGLEAFLAVMTLFVVHFFNNHFRPAKFPLDTVMFTGKWDLEELKEERPLHYQRLKDSGQLEQHLVAPTTKTTKIITHVLGFTLLGVGLLLLILVLIGFSRRGFV